MSDLFKVPHTKILEITNHPGADRLEIARVFDFNVVIPKSKYKVGDEIIYIPIDSVIKNKELENKLFPEGSKITLHNSRVRQIKIRGFPSQGMIVDVEDVLEFLDLDKVKSFEGYEDLALDLSIEKYEPPVSGPSTTLKKGNYRRAADHPNFHQFNSVNNIKWFPDVFSNGDTVVIQEKLHGTNARAALLPFIADTWFKKLLKWLNLAPAVYKAYGSNRVEISASRSYKGYYGEDIYGSTFQKEDVFSKLKLGETVFGEIVGPGIQKGYDYGLKEHKFILFDVKVLQTDGSQIWLNPDEVERFATERGFTFVPVLYKGIFNKEQAYALTRGPSEFNDKSEKVREGIVIKAAENYSVDGNKRAFKWVSEDYLSDTKNTDNH